MKKKPLIERGLTVKAKSGQPPPRWRGGTPCQSSPDAAEEHQIEQPVGREKRGLIGEDAWCPSPPPPHLLPPETNDNEGENQEHPDLARRIWIPPSGITPRHGKKPARSRTKAQTTTGTSNFSTISGRHRRRRGLPAGPGWGRSTLKGAGVIVFERGEERSIPRFTQGLFLVS
jgi:hypothetical protein